MESTPNIDIRKNLFRALADKGWPMLGMEPVGMELEDVFMRLINSTNENIKAKGGRK